MSTTSDLLEPVTVTMTVEDWAEVLGALLTSDCSPAARARISTKIYTCVERTERTLS